METLLSISSKIRSIFLTEKKRKREESPEEVFNRIKRVKRSRSMRIDKEEEIHYSQPSIFQRTVTPYPLPIQTWHNTTYIQDPQLLFEEFVPSENRNSISELEHKSQILKGALELAEQHLQAFSSDSVEDMMEFEQAVDTITNLTLCTEPYSTFLSSDSSYFEPSTSQSTVPINTYKEETLQSSIPASPGVEMLDIQPSHTQDSRFEKALDEICNIELYTDTLPPEISPSKNPIISEKQAYLDEILKYQEKYNLFRFNKQQLQDLDKLIEECDFNDLIVKIGNTPIHGRDFKRLALKSWLNDEIINAYLELISPAGDIIVFNTFFYEILKGMYQSQQLDTNRIRRILRKKGISGFTECRVSVIPVNIKDYHWALVVIDNIAKTVFYYDSLNDNWSEEIFDTISFCLNSELKDEDYNCKIADCPKQENGSDCGLFVLRTVECVINKEDVKFSQEDMNYYRYVIGWRLLNKALD